ncbi:type II toxin-antitoxin system HipA family toxin YjjJ [Aquabacterium humicola]|uniref:type II toxin-antitoxin system HipA family toxin YjjJ n=1 Tax=Aquabacterium humicola TaxID=3237377 RepID=UPI002542A388|nr:type II toxin-antitoxin system HipA family toxin YjjJ [Rubrivivax pictus]
MRPRNQTARERLRGVLARRPAGAAADIAAELGISKPTLHRLFAELADEIVTTGRARRTRHALRQPLRGELAPLPLYEVDQQGRAERVAEFALIQPEGSCLDLAALGWPVPDESRDGWWRGLPYPFYDMRPQGYLGRQFARAEHAALAVPDDPERWRDEHIVHVLNRAGADVIGNLILGDPAFERWQRQRLQRDEPLPARGLAKAYAALADQAVSRGVFRSSAAGEFPKFTALREAEAGADSRTPHVLVKFSGADAASPAERRWADLLVCEHLALQCCALLPGVEVARSRVLGAGGRTLLEVERFDRHGFFGRSRLTSLTLIDGALLGIGTSDWTLLAERLVAAGLLETDDEARIQMLWWFGRQIANTDMHTGNLSFRPEDQRLTLAPAYDMLPMLYAPLAGGEVPVRQFEPPLPRPPQRLPWLAAFDAALTFWHAAAADARLSEAFRAICAVNATRLQDVAAHA